MKLSANYKQTDLGLIPEDWEVRPLSAIGTFSKGQGIRKNEAASGEIPCIRYGEIYTHHNDIVRTYNSYISREVAATSKRLIKGDVLFAGSGETKEEIGKAIAFLGDEEVYAGGDIVILSPKNQSSEFLGYLLNAPMVERQKASKGQGDAVVHISSTALGVVMVPLPSYSEQRAIATALSDVDELLAAQDKLIAKKRDIKQAAMQQLLTGKQRLPGFSGEWGVKTIGELCEYQNGTSLEHLFNPDAGLKVISIGNYSVTGGYIDNGVYINHKQRKLVDKYVLKKNDLTMSMNDKTSVGAIIGRVLLIEHDDMFVFNQRTMRLRPKLNVSPAYLYHAINADHAHSALVGLAKPGTQIYINTDDVVDFKLPVPSFPEQTAIATILSDMDADLAALEQQRDKTRALKQGMMQELLTGRIRLV